MNVNPAVHLASHAPSGRTASVAFANRVLVVDDDCGIRGLVSAILQQIGYSVHCAEDGEEAWGALTAERFDLLIIDHEMPRLTGLDLVRRARASSIKLPVILISGNIPWEAPDLLPLLRPGTALAKPFSKFALLTHVHGMLASSECDEGGCAAVPYLEPAPPRERGFA